MEQHQQQELQQQDDEVNSHIFLPGRFRVFVFFMFGPIDGNICVI